ncbi:hypothetical protein ANN_09267 [Periplaneta americana]|uniref:Uncharacterized protein n=1 Tax=Periplaneta americana TaxID=6978 RepID=A0ABQ8TLT4_PERAM|nr:hypothetical protein ANN_09267 [Periplaneta americana]
MSRFVAHISKTKSIKGHLGHRDDRDESIAVPKNNVQSCREYRPRLKAERQKGQDAHGESECSVSATVVPDISIKRRYELYYWYDCETWTLTLREEQRLRIFENKVLRKVFGAKRDEVIGEWRKLHNAELHALHPSPDIIRNIKSRCLRWAGHVARMGESRNAYRVLVGRPEGKNLWGGRDVDGKIILVILNELETVENSGPWKKDVTSVEMVANYSVVITPVYKKTINKGRKHRINIDEWKDVKRKSLKEHGKEYTSRNGIVKRAKQPPNCLSGIKIATARGNGMDLVEEENEKRADEFFASNGIKEMCKKREAVQNFVQIHHPNKAVAVRAINLFNDNIMSLFRRFLKTKQNQVSLRRVLSQKKQKSEANNHCYEHRGKVGQLPSSESRSLAIQRKYVTCNRANVAHLPSGKSRSPAIEQKQRERANAAREWRESARATAAYGVNGGRTLPTLREVRRSGDIQIILCTPVEISRNYDFAIKEETPANSSSFQLISQPVSEKARASKPVLCTGVRLVCASATVPASEGLSSSAVDRSWRDLSSSAVDRRWRDLSSSTVDCL